jgi:hypothetical protein
VLVLLRWPVSPRAADGTEAFQPEQSLPVTERARVVAAAGERCESLCFVNCVMERESFDTVITGLAATGLRRCLNQPETLSAEPEFPIGARQGDPSDAVTWDAAANARHASLPSQFVLSRRELVDLATMLLADWLQQVPHHEASMDAELKPIHMESHTLGGIKGNWVIPRGGWYSVRRDTWEAIAVILGGQAEEDYRRVFGALDSVAEAPCHWRPLESGEVMAREAMRAHGAKEGSRLAGTQAPGESSKPAMEQQAATAMESAATEGREEEATGAWPGLPSTAAVARALSRL